MPRPSKHVSPDTLGGVIRAAREHQHLSLAQVASGQYSTSLISQIERNRVDPSAESLAFLAARLELPIDDLKIFAFQQRESEVEAREYRSFETLRSQATELLQEKRVDEALASLSSLHFSQVPALQRWRLAALRGRCYFERRLFVKAQGDLVYAVQEEPLSEQLPADQQIERMLLHLELAATYRELNHIDSALEQFDVALRLMNRDTPAGYIAEANWGKAVIALSLSTKGQTHASERAAQLDQALKHAEYAQVLYQTIGEPLAAASVAYTVYDIEFERGNRERARQGLLKLVEKWALQDSNPTGITLREQCRQKDQAKVVSQASNLLANIAYAQGDYQQALLYAQNALDAGKRSYIVPRAYANLMLGQIFEAVHCDEQAEQAYCDALRELEATERIGAQISIHIRLGMLLARLPEREKDGRRELERAQQLSEVVVPPSY